MLAVALFWGANFSANKYGVSVLPPMVFAAIRFSVATLVLTAVVWWRGADHRMPTRTAWLLAGLGVIGNTAYQVLFMLGLGTTSAVNASLIMAALPVAVAVLGWALQVERTTGRTWVGIAIATAGVATVIAAKGLRFSGATIHGDLLVLLAVVCWAVFTVGVRSVGRGHDPIRVTTLTVAGGTPGLVLAALPSIGTVDFGALPAGAWIAIGYSSVVAIVIAYLLWSVAIQALGGSRTAIYNCVAPLFAAVTARVTLGERLVPSQGIGAGLVIAGVLISQGVFARTAPGSVPVADP